MALAVTIQIDFKDAKNKPSSTKIRVPTGFSIAQYVEFAQGAAQVIADVSTARIVGVSVNVGLDLSGATLTNVAGVAADVGSKALMIWNSAVAGLKAKFQLPTFDEDTYVVLGTDTIDEAATNMAALITAVETGYTVTSGLIDITDKSGNDIESLSTGRELFRRHIG